MGELCLAHIAATYLAAKAPTVSVWHLLKHCGWESDANTGHQESTAGESQGDFRVGAKIKAIRLRDEIHVWEARGKAGGLTRGCRIAFYVANFAGPKRGRNAAQKWARTGLVL